LEQREYNIFTKLTLGTRKHQVGELILKSQQVTLPQLEAMIATDPLKIERKFVGNMENSHTSLLTWITLSDLNYKQILLFGYNE
jgi:hypothetical protein